MNYKLIYFWGCYTIVIVMLVVVISGCSSTQNIKQFDSFKAQSCLKVYCENSENSKSKRAGLTLIGIAASVYNVDLDLNRGICEEYYIKRAGADYRYLKAPAEEVCTGE